MIIYIYFYKNKINWYFIYFNKNKIIIFSIIINCLEELHIKLYLLLFCYYNY